MIRTNRPCNADISIVNIARLFPLHTFFKSVSTSATIESILSMSLPSNIGRIDITPHGDITMAISTAAVAGTHALLKSNVTYTFEGYAEILRKINLSASGSTNVSFILYCDDTVEKNEWESSSSTSSMSSASTESSSYSTQSSASSASTESSSYSTKSSASSDSSD